MNRRSLVRRLLRGTAAFALSALALWGGYRFWFTHRAQPPDEERALFEGVTYRRWSLRYPRPLVLHLATVDLTAPGIGFTVTGGDAGQELPIKASTTSQFAAASGAQLAINADFFYPWYSHSPLSYYPHVGERVRTEGDAVSEWRVLCRRPDRRPDLTTLRLSRNGHVTLGDVEPGAYNAVGGHVLDPYPSRPEPPSELQPCAAVGIDAEGKRLYLLVVDGRQPGYSEGVTRAELAGFLREAGAARAIQFDGGGSATMVAAGQDGRPRVLNCPIDSRIPGRERPVANHLGIFARPLPADR